MPLALLFYDCRFETSRLLTNPSQLSFLGAIVKLQACVNFAYGSSDKVETFDGVVLESVNLKDLSDPSRLCSGMIENDLSGR